MTQTRGTLDRDLAQIQDDILRLGSMTEEAIQRSIKALKQRDVDLAQQIIANDANINDLRYAIEEQCITVIATQQPVASDMRTLAAVLEITTELERIGDYAKGIAKIDLLIGDQPLLKPLIDLPVMADKACNMLHRALQAFVERDEALARLIPGEDDEVDYLYNQKPIPMDAKGVPVTLDALAPDGQFINIGTVISDMSGMFKKMWTPDQEGEYTIIATFEGSDSYWSSYTETALGVGPAPAPSGQIEPEAFAITTTEIALIAAVAIAVVIGIAAFALMKKRD